MALKPDANFTNFTAATADYPQGSSKNDSTGTAGDGTEHNALRANDIFGMQQALLRLGGLTPTETADTALDSQYIHGMIQLVQGRATLFDDGGVADAYLATPRTNQQTANGLFEGQRFRVLIDNTNTGASTLDISKIEDQDAAFGSSVVDIHLPGGTVDPSAGDLLAGEEVEFVYRTSPSAHVELVPPRKEISVYNANNTWNNSGWDFVLVIVIGSGGGSGGTQATAPGQGAVADGGGGGGVSISIVDVRGVASVSVTVGTGGLAGASASNGGNGNTSSFGAFLSATGGLGGQLGTVTTSDAMGGRGSLPGNGVGGDLNFDGDAGLPGYMSVSANDSVGGPGGGTFFSGHRRYSNNNTNGDAGTEPGQGGSGACSNANQSARVGAAGADGQVIVIGLK